MKRFDKSGFLLIFGFFMNVFNLIESYLYRHTKIFNDNRSIKYNSWIMLSNSNWLLLVFFVRYMHRHLSIKYEVKISKYFNIGCLYLGHAILIIINKSSSVGESCNPSQFLTIGSSHDKTAKIGNNVYIDPNVCIVENVLISNNIVISANSFIFKNIFYNHRVVCNSAHFISNKSIARYINNPIQRTDN